MNNSSFSKLARLNSRDVLFILFINIGLALVFTYGSTASGHSFETDLFGSGIAGKISAIFIWIASAIFMGVAISAPITSLIALVLLAHSSFRSHSEEKIHWLKKLFKLNFDTIAYYALFWILIISWCFSQDVIFPAGRNTRLLMLFALVLGTTSISLGIKAFLSKSLISQVSVLFLSLLVLGALFLNIHTLSQPYYAPKILAKYPSPDKKYTVILFQQKNEHDIEKFYGFQAKSQKYASRLGGWCRPRFIKWIDVETILLSVDGLDRQVKIKGNKPSVQCP